MHCSLAELYIVVEANSMYVHNISVVSFVYELRYAKLPWKRSMYKCNRGRGERGPKQCCHLAYSLPKGLADLKSNSKKKWAYLLSVRHAAKLK